MWRRSRKNYHKCKINDFFHCIMSKSRQFCSWVLKPCGMQSRKPYPAMKKKWMKIINFDEDLWPGWIPGGNMICQRFVQAKQGGRHDMSTFVQNGIWAGGLRSHLSRGNLNMALLWRGKWAPQAKILGFQSATVGGFTLQNECWRRIFLRFQSTQL